MAQSDFKSLISEIGYANTVNDVVISKIEKTFKSTGDRNLDKYVLGQVFDAQIKLGNAEVEVGDIFDKDIPKLVRVSPGDLITAGLLNDIIDAIQALELRTRRIAAALQRKETQPEKVAEVAVAPPAVTVVPTREAEPTANYRKRGQGYIMTIEAEDLDRTTVKGVRVGDKLFTGDEINFYDGKMTVAVETKPVEDMAVVIEKTNKKPVAMLATPAASKKAGAGAVIGAQKLER